MPSRSLAISESAFALLQPLARFSRNSFFGLIRQRFEARVVAPACDPPNRRALRSARGPSRIFDPHLARRRAATPWAPLELGARGAKANADERPRRRAARARSRAPNTRGPSLARDLSAPSTLAARSTTARALALRALRAERRGQRSRAVPSGVPRYRATSASDQRRRAPTHGADRRAEQARARPRMGAAPPRAAPTS